MSGIPAIKTDDELLDAISRYQYKPFNIAQYGLDFSISDEASAQLETVLNEHLNQTNYAELTGWKKSISRFLPKPLVRVIQEKSNEIVPVPTKAKIIIDRYEAAMAALRKNIDPSKRVIEDIDAKIRELTLAFEQISAYLEQNPECKNYDLAATRLLNLRGGIDSLTKVRNDVESQLGARMMSFEALQAQFEIIDTVINASILSTQSAAEVVSSQSLAAKTRELANRLFIESAQVTATMKEQSVETVFSTVLTDKTLAQVEKIESESRAKLGKMVVEARASQRQNMAAIADMSSRETLRLHELVHATNKDQKK